MLVSVITILSYFSWCFIYVIAILYVGCEIYEN